MTRLMHNPTKAKPHVSRLDISSELQVSQTAEGRDERWWSAMAAQNAAEVGACMLHKGLCVHELRCLLCVRVQPRTRLCTSPGMPVQAVTQAEATGV